MRKEKRKSFFYAVVDGVRVYLCASIRRIIHMALRAYLFHIVKIGLLKKTRRYLYDSIVKLRRKMEGIIRRRKTNEKNTPKSATITIDLVAVQYRSIARLNRIQIVCDRVVCQFAHDKNREREKINKNSFYRSA